MANYNAGAAPPGHPRQCTATSKSSRKQCQNWAMKGQRICRLHGGKAPHSLSSARERLAQLAGPAVATLEDIRADLDNDAATRLRAATAILDRTGFGPTVRIVGNERLDTLLDRLDGVLEAELVDDDGDVTTGPTFDDRIIDVTPEPPALEAG